MVFPPVTFPKVKFPKLERARFLLKAMAVMQLIIMVQLSFVIYQSAVHEMTRKADTAFLLGRDDALGTEAASSPETSILDIEADTGEAQDKQTLSGLLSSLDFVSTNVTNMDAQIRRIEEKLDYGVHCTN